MKGCDVVKCFIQRIKNSIEQDFNQFFHEDGALSKRILLKWLFIGFLIFLLVLFLFLQASFKPDSQTEPLPPILEEEDSIIETEEEFDDGPMFEFETEGMEELSESEEVILKDRIWRFLMEGDYQSAADLISNTVNSNALREESDLLNWYQDVYVVATVQNIEPSQQDQILSSFKTPRFQAVFPTFTSVLTLAKIVEDPDSLLPIDVEHVQIMSESFVDPSECQNVSPYMDQMLIHFKEIYKASILFNGELVTAYVGIFNNDYLQLLGYYGESDLLKTDSYWESKRLDYALNPNF